MGYHGNIVTIPLGLAGLRSDDPQTLLDPSDLILANDVHLGQGLIEKSYGSKAYNVYPINDGETGPLGIRAFFDWWPDEATQRIVILNSQGQMHKIIDPYNTVDLMADSLAGSGAPALGTSPVYLSSVDQAHFLQCGIESIGRSRKLFLFNGRDPVQVITGNNNYRSNIALGASDWTGTNQPSFGILHKGRVIAFGNRNNPHQIYISDDDNHENFQTGGATYQVYPGEGDRLFTGFLYKGRVFLGKYPRGVYYIDDANPNVEEWGIVKVSDSFGVASVHPAAEVIDDLLVGNTTGSVTSLNATQAFGDVKSGDVLTNLRAEQFMRANTDQAGNLDRWAMYDADKKRVYFTYRSSGGARNDRIMMIDYSGQKPKVTWHTKDQPNCLGLIKDVYGVQRPAYGSEDGFLYFMDSPDRAVTNSSFTFDSVDPFTGINWETSRDSQFQGYLSEFQTPHMDFAQGDPARAESKKIFQGLEVVFEPTGRWNIFVDVFIDGLFVETIPYKVGWGAILGDFRLGRDRLSARVPRSIGKPLHGEGRRISFRVYNSGERENFRLCALRVYFKYSGQKQDNQAERPEAG